MSVIGQVDPIPMLLWCPECGARHIDVGDFATRLHHTHACQECGMVWRPAIVYTVGVAFLPGFRNAAQTDECPTCFDGTCAVHRAPVLPPNHPAAPPQREVDGFGAPVKR